MRHRGPRDLHRNENRRLAKRLAEVRGREIPIFPSLDAFYASQSADLAVINTNTRIDTPSRAAKWDGSATIPIAGVAFSGARGISTVEVSADGGKTFNAAELEPALGQLTWVRWKLDWTPSGTGKFTIVARSTDQTGERETEIQRDPFPSGATGWDSVDVIITRG